jgi:zinc transport system substrate-binding protein
VANLTPPGAEPHDLELGPRQVAAVGEADLVVYLAGFQPAVDEAVRQEASGTSLDVTPAAALVEVGGASDPHFWLDPLRLADVGDSVAARLGEVDPSRAQDFADGAADVRAELEALDAEMQEGLAGCEGTDLVTSHTAFGYLASRYGMEQVGITGLSPESEPSPRALADVAAHVAANDVRTIYSETLVSPAVAETLARETGARTAVLDPLEGLSSGSAGEDYLAVMRSNLAVLQEGQPCP